MVEIGHTSSAIRFHPAKRFALPACRTQLPTAMSDAELKELLSPGKVSDDYKIGKELGSCVGSPRSCPCIISCLVVSLPLQ